MKKAFKIIFKVLLSLVLVLLCVVGIFFAYAAITTYHPIDVEAMKVEGEKDTKAKLNEDIKIMSWNIGYCGLDQDVDFFMDGGKMVRALRKERVVDNANAISKEITNENADIILLQETDLSSKRSYYVDEKELITSLISKDYVSTYACNFRAGYVPYPFPTTLGRVEGGLVSYSKFGITKAERIQLPIPFSWPMSMFNLKRCLLVKRIKIENSDKELVVINQHLEAYDSGEGKIAQTKMLKEYMEAEYKKGNYVIVGGDFNQTFSNVDLSKYKVVEGTWQPGRIDIAEFAEFNLLMDQEHPSCRSLDKPLKGADTTNFQYYIIDGFMVSKNITVNSFGTKDLGFVNSDHNPVLLNIKLN